MHPAYFFFVGMAAPLAAAVLSFLGFLASRLLRICPLARKCSG
jgi:hypothetical protein